MVLYCIFIDTGNNFPKIMLLEGPNKKDPWKFRHKLPPIVITYAVQAIRPGAKRVNAKGGHPLPTQVLMWVKSGFWGTQVPRGLFNSAGGDASWCKVMHSTCYSSDRVGVPHCNAGPSLGSSCGVQGDSPRVRRCPCVQGLPLCQRRPA